VQANEEIAMNPGDFWYIPGDTRHGVRTGERNAIIMDIFSPLRMPFTQPGEGLAAKERQAKSRGQLHRLPKWLGTAKRITGAIWCRSER
jgi:hypothetical protein